MFETKIVECKKIYLLILSVIDFGIIKIRLRSSIFLKWKRNFYIAYSYNWSWELFKTVQ